MGHRGNSLGVPYRCGNHRLRVATAERLRPYGSHHLGTYHLCRCFRGSELGERRMSLRTLGIVMAIIAAIILIATDPAFLQGFRESWNK